MKDGVGMSHYGIGSIYRRYAGISDDLPIPASSIHAWVTLGTPWETTYNPPEIWVWTEAQREIYSRFYPKDKTRAVGCAFCYLCKMLGIERDPLSEREGSVFFTPHSIPAVNVVIDHNKISDWLVALSDEYKPVSVFLYYVDATPEVVFAYESKGISVLTNGHVFDSDFLYNYIANVAGRKYCFFVNPGTAALYAGYMGLTLVHADFSYTFHGREEFSDYLDEGRKMNPDRRRFLLDSTQEDYAAVLGEANILSPSGLHDLILSLARPS
ncbi:hypothetical protein [Stutzerimonas nitrititolerans]|uniref:hypothetical protein n=1 Tax=Stutzerimonas nitrititolerans TaxID=2482751 RepID=UPI00289E424A|nr:hypothetical protein [Stutzerimonas nitrititolerans]